mmetsp:Transcript_32171/g.52178  ORF Transcript_32171/g.52178 Transcript_32171/m.52178 type:complete len:95 (-) Transcript_32171:366-650(-)
MTTTSWYIAVSLMMAMAADAAADGDGTADGSEDRDSSGDYSVIVASSSFVSAASFFGAPELSPHVKSARIRVKTRDPIESNRSCYLRPLPQVLA